MIIIIISSSSSSSSSIIITRWTELVLLQYQEMNCNDALHFSIQFKCVKTLRQAVITLKNLTFGFDWKVTMGVYCLWAAYVLYFRP